jgi:hypothetical protein
MVVDATNRRLAGRLQDRSVCGQTAARLWDLCGRFPNRPGCIEIDVRLCEGDVKEAIESFKSRRSSMLIQRRSGWALVLVAAVAMLAVSPAMAQTFDVTPVTPKNVSSPVGGPASPGSMVYTVHNTGVTPLTVTAEEVDVTGAAAVYGWLDLGSATTGSLGPDASGTITATFDTTAVAAERYEAYIKFTDGSTQAIRALRLYDGIPVPCYDEAFSYYPDGNLEGLGGWTGTTGSQITVSAQRALLTYNQDYHGTTITQVLPTPVSGNTILWHASVFSGGTAIDGNAFDLRLEDPQGNSFARWYGGAYWERPRIGDGSCVLGNAVLNEGVWNDLLVTVDTVAKTSTFSLNGTVLGTLTYGGGCLGSPEPSNVVGRIRMGFQNAGTAQNGAIKYYDNIWVRADSCNTVCSESLTPAVGSVSVAEVGAAADPPTQAFTVTNTNSLDASYTVATVDVNGAPATYGWLSLDKTAGPTLTPEQTDVVTATLDTTDLLADEYVGFLKFTNTCTPAIWYRPITLQVLGSNCLLEKFPYMAGPLNGQPGWSGADSTGAITVLSGGVMRLSGYAVGTANGPLITADHQTNGCACAAGQLQTVSVKVSGHTGGSRFWELHFLDSIGNDLAGWRGQAGSVEAYMRGLTLPVAGTLTPLTGGGQFDTLEATINTNETVVNGINANSTLFTLVYASGTRNVLGTIGHGAILAPPVQTVRFTRLVNNVAADTDPVIDFDELVVQKCAEQCNDPVFDVRDITNAAVADGHVDSHDYQAFEACATGPGITAELSFECKCMDLNNDDAIDQTDFAVFQRCYSGSVDPVDPLCDN